MQPMHTDACKSDNGKYTCLHAIDADHFWIGDLMVDMNLLWREAQRLSRDQMLGSSHSVVFNLQYLQHASTHLVANDIKFIGHAQVAKSLLRLNELGMPTGFSEENK